MCADIMRVHMCAYVSIIFSRNRDASELHSLSFHFCLSYCPVTAVLSRDRMVYFPFHMMDAFARARSVVGGEEGARDERMKRAHFRV